MTHGCIARAFDFCLSYQTPANHAATVKHYSSMAFGVDAYHYKCYGLPDRALCKTFSYGVLTYHCNSSN